MKKELREKIYNKYQGHCAYCGDEITYKQMQVDHIFPQAKNHWIKGREVMQQHTNTPIPKDIDDFDNLNPACRKCNLWKGVFSIELFRSEILDQVKRANNYSANYRMAKKYGLITETAMPVVFYFENVSEKT